MGVSTETYLYLAWRADQHFLVLEYNKSACVAQTTVPRRTVRARTVLVSRQTYRNKTNAAARKAITIFSVLARIVSHYNYLLYVFHFIETKILSGSDYNI